ncbi:MAG: alpha/beta hydrolase [Candidatus Lambdaproteobacteria bacterium]|nr:alpha/beta hydrolase [Candidatus Lambdaproteobacteria bacterium]
MASKLFERAGGRRLSWEDGGNGPAIVLVHGSPGAARNWRDVRGRLEDRYRVVAPDMPGHGRSDPRPAASPPRTDDVADDVEALAASLGAPLLLVGHSYGGNVALQVALRGRVPVVGLVLFEPVALKVLALLGDDAFAPTRAVFDDYVARVTGGEHRAVERMVDFWFGAGAFARMPEAVQGALVAGAPANALDVQASFNETHSREALAKLAYPVLTVYGSRSPQVSLRIAQAVTACVPRGELRTLEGGTHAMTATHAPAVAELIGEMAGRCFA